MEGLQLHTLLIDPRASALQSDGIIQLRIECQHMQLNLLALHDILGIEHILNQLAITRSCRMNPNQRLGFVLTLLVGCLLLRVLLVAIQSRLSSLIRSRNGCRKNLVDIVSHRLIRSRMANDI